MSINIDLCHYLMVSWKSILQICHHFWFFCFLNYIPYKWVSGHFHFLFFPEIINSHVQLYFTINFFNHKDQFKKFNMNPKNAAESSFLGTLINQAGVEHRSCHLRAMGLQIRQSASLNFCYHIWGNSNMCHLWVECLALYLAHRGALWQVAVVVRAPPSARCVWTSGV